MSDKKPEEIQLINVRVSSGLVKQLDELMKDYNFISRSQLVRTLLAESVDRHNIQKLKEAKGR